MTGQTGIGMALGVAPRIAIEDRCAEALVERILHEAEPYLERAAAKIAAEYPAAAAEMVQEARITLWELDIGRFAQRDKPYLGRILYNRMIDVYRSECRGGSALGSGTRGTDERVDAIDEGT